MIGKKRNLQLFSCNFKAFNLTILESPLYKHSFRKRNNTYQEAKIILYDDQDERIKFRLFRDCDLEVDIEIQSQLKSCEMDDDCPTDS